MAERLKELSLFSGVGGGLLASVLLDHKIIGAVEMDSYCCQVLEQRQKDDIFEKFPIFNTDIRDFIRHGYAELYKGRVDVLSAGFPCQPFSVAGKRKAQDDSRNMWPATLECIRIIRPKYCFLENVRGLLSTGYFQEILKDLAESGYDARWRVLSAAELGAPHRRDRLWIVAYTSGTGAGLVSGRPSRSGGQTRQLTNARQSAMVRQEYGTSGAERLDTGSSDVPNTNCEHGIRGSQSQQSIGQGGEAWNQPSGRIANVADANSKRELQPKGSVQNKRGRSSYSTTEVPNSAINRLEKGREASRTRSKRPTTNTWWQTEPRVDRLVDGIPNRVDRLKALGNAQVPIVAAKAWRLLTEDIL